jgi:hypothetical protein
MEIQHQTEIERYGIPIPRLMNVKLKHILTQK